MSVGVVRPAAYGRVTEQCVQGDGLEQRQVADLDREVHVDRERLPQGLLAPRLAFLGRLLPGLLGQELAGGTQYVSAAQEVGVVGPARCLLRVPALRAAHVVQ
jgi:hypothetical protein